MRIDSRLNKNPHLLKVGDKVTSEFHNDREQIYTLTALRPDPTRGSGYRASAEPEMCPTCGHGSEPIRDVDASWFLPVAPTPSAEEDSRRA